MPTETPPAPAAPAHTRPENGPYHLSHNLTLTDNPWGWDAAAHVIFVDQPINTGFSWSDVRGGFLGGAGVL
jgi:hypothetical protein